MERKQEHWKPFGNPDHETQKSKRWRVSDWVGTVVRLEKMVTNGFAMFPPSILMKCTHKHGGLCLSSSCRTCEKRSIRNVDTKSTSLQGRIVEGAETPFLSMPVMEIGLSWENDTYFLLEPSPRTGLVVTDSSSESGEFVVTSKYRDKLNVVSMPCPECGVMHKSEKNPDDVDFVGRLYPVEGKSYSYNLIRNRLFTFPRELRQSDIDALYPIFKEMTDAYYAEVNLPNMGIQPDILTTRSKMLKASITQHFGGYNKRLEQLVYESLFNLYSKDSQG